MVNYAAIIKTGCLAVKSVFPNTKTMVHVSNGYNNDLFKWNIGGLIKNGAVFDMIGMSLYPSTTDWTTKNDQILYNMNNMVELYGKEIMVVEVGMAWDSPNECKLFLTDLIAKVKSVKNKKVLEYSIGNRSHRTIGMDIRLAHLMQVVNPVWRFLLF